MDSAMVRANIDLTNKYKKITSICSTPIMSGVSSIIIVTKSDLSKNSCLTKSDNFLSDSNFHVFNECIHEFLNKVLLTVIPQAEQTDVAPNDGSTSFKKIAKVHNGIVMIDSCELFDLNYGQTVDPFQTRQSMIQSFNIGTNVEETTIIPNNLPRPADNLTPNNNSTFVLRDCNSQAFIKYIPTVMSRDNGLIKIKKRLQLANLTNLSEQASKTILLLQAGDMSRMSAKVTESAHKYIQPSTSLFCLDNSLDQYHWTSFENFYLSRMPLVTVGHNISSKNIQSKKLIYLSHILNIPSIVHIATVWHRCIKYEMIKNHSNTTSTAHGMHNWMDKKQTESFVKVLDILTELQGISNGLMQVVTIVGFQHIYHPVYVITQHCSYFYHISSFNYVNYYETIKLREDDYSKCLAPYGSFYSIYASDCGDLICSKHANIGDGIYVANNNTISNFKRSGVEYSNFGINMCNICTSIQTLQTVSSNSILSSRTSSSTALTKNKKRITIFCHKQPVIRSSGCTVTRFSNMAGDSKLPINIHYPIELKDISTSSVSIQRLDIETKIKRNVLFTMYIALVVIIFSMLSMPQILVNLLY